MSLSRVSQTAWGEYDSSRRLSDRISDITLWKKSLEACAEELDTEMDALTLVSGVIALLMVKPATYSHINSFKDRSTFYSSSIICHASYLPMFSWQIYSWLPYH